MHRSGRTGRAGNEGNSLLLCTPGEVSSFKKLCNALKKPKGLEEFPVEQRELHALHDRVKLAKQIAEIEDKNSKVFQYFNFRVKVKKAGM